MANNEILPFAGTDTGTNLLTQTEYNADSQRPIGNQPGVARSKLVNKVLRQTSLIAAAIAQYFANRQSNDIVDSLTPATLAGYMLNAIGGDTQKSSFNSAIAAGTADAITASYTPVVASLTNGLSLFVRATAANTSTTPTFTPNSGTVTAKAIVKGAGSALVAGDIAGAGHWLELQYDSTLDRWVLQNPAYGINAVSSASTQGGFKNLKVSATGTNATITISYDELILGDGSGNNVVERNVAGTINTATTGAGGLDTGAIAVSTWYSIWRIGKTDGTRSFLFSLSSTAPTMPSGYTLKARIGWFRTDGSANKFPFGFTQYGRRAQWLVAAGSNIASPYLMASGTSVAVWTAVATGAYVPPTASKIQVTLSCLNIFSNAGFSVAPNNAYASTNAFVGLYQGNTNGTNLIANADLALESTSIYWGGSSTGTSSLYCNGWEDNI